MNTLTNRTPAHLTTRSRHRLRTIAFAGALAILMSLLSPQRGELAARQADPCAAPPDGNPVVCENQKPGDLASEWDISGAGDSTIQGFATEVSVNRGQTIDFKIDTDAALYHLDIYRMGYYGGLGARKIATVVPAATLPQTQPACLNDAPTGLIDCGNWQVSASWAVPSTAVSGIYFAKVIRADTSGASHILFVVRDDTGHSDLLFQTSDTTWQAYNQYGGNSLYVGAPAGRAYKVSYNRPLTVRGTSPEDSVFNAEYPMVRFLEANGFNVSYFSGLDSDRLGAEIIEHKVFLSVGHDEYWSGTQRANVEAARAAGVNLAFFSGNEVFWKTRWEDSLSAPATSYRTLVSYKETHANAKIDPLPNVWTGAWEDPRFSPPADGGRPANALTGTLFRVNTGTGALTVPAAEGRLRFWRNTAVASQAPGGSMMLSDGTLGYEWDEDVDNDFRPEGLIRLSDTTMSGVDRLQDYGSTYALGTANHALTLYRHASGALVFGAGTVQWSWGLDGNHERGASVPSIPMQQATINLLADMGAQPLTLQPGLVPAAPSADTIKPTSTITAPANGSGVPANTFITISGTASDGEGGAVGAVELSADGGATWMRATGRENWSISWHTGSAGPATLFSRAIDDAGNIEQATTGITLDVGAVAATCPCSVWHPSQQPALAAAPDTSAVEVGTRFRSDVSGYATAIRFYKSAQNTGAHVGNLWTDAGALLSSVTFTGESASGWQEATLDTPIAIAADTTYVVSYHTNSGFYAADSGYFASSGVRNGPLYAPADGEFGANGLFKYGPTSFPNLTSSSSNYWVDVVFATSILPDTTSPTVTAVSPLGGASDTPTATVVSGIFSERIDAATVTSSTFELRDGTNSLVPAVVAYSSSTRSTTLTPVSPLAFSSTFTARLVGGSSGIKDVAGNALAADVTWSFTTGWAAPPPPAEGPGGPILLVTSSANPFTSYYAEILRAEGLNGFEVSDITTLTPSTLAAHDVVILGEVPLNAAQVNELADWVSGGGKLIAMRPDKQLAGLLGLSDSGTSLSDAYLKVDTSAAPGAGIVGQSMQFHGTADRYTLNGATSVATLYSTATGATSAPAVTLRNVGTLGGQAAAFTYDLARSVVFTRQGNPALAGQERDGIAPIRSDELFFGGTGPDYVDFAKIAIPQADEQQRLLANLIGHLTAAQRPIPRFWYFPRGEKAVVVMTGDDHGLNGTAGRFDIYKSNSPAGCHVNDWECVRATSYIYPSTPISNAQVGAYVADGFEIGVHVTTGCDNYTPVSLQANFVNDLAAFTNLFPSAPPTRSSRTHCIAWSDYDTQPQVELANGIRLDTNYYYWPGFWVQDRPGFMTGSGMPMRFAKADGTLIDVYQAATQMTDESDQTWPFTVDTLLDRALGAEGYYGFFTANMHTDNAVHAGSEAIVASAQARGVPVISAKQLLDWLDGRNQATYTAPSWAGDTLTFTVAADARANGLQMLLPAMSGRRALTGVTRNGQPVAFTLQQIKGVTYAVFTSRPGAYAVQYPTDSTPATLTALAVTPDATAATITWTTSELATSLVSYGTNPNGLSSSTSSAAFTTAHAITITGLTPGTTYYFRASSTDMADNSATAPNPPAAPMSFVTLLTASLGCPCSIWDGTTVPSQPSAADTNAIEVGVKFRPSANGYITAVRFYKGALNTGVHVGNLWSSAGALLGTVTFTSETGSGWQQARLAQPVAVNANTTYVVSYHTTTGGFAFDPQYFQSTGVTNGPLQALAEGVSGSNGVFLYGNSAFPTQSNNSSNYWVDVEFVTAVPPFAPPAVGLTDTTVADFMGGVAGPGSYVSGAGGGELVLAPTQEHDFTGAGLPTGWASPVPWAVGGAATFSGGHTSVDGTLLRSDTLLSPDQSIEFVATFSADAAQHGGFAFDFNDNRWAIFSTGSGGGLSARSNNGVTPIDTPLAGSWLGAPHRFRIDWTSSTVTFYIDGTLVASHNQSISGQLFLAFSDFSVGGGSLAIESLRVGPYATTGTFTSRVMDAGTAVDWSSVSSTAVMPLGSAIALSARFGNTPVPDASWTSFSSITVGTATLSGTSRYVQYSAAVTGTGTETPRLESITFAGPAVPASPGVSVADVVLAEGNSGTTFAAFTISLAAATSRPVTVAYATSDDTASAGSDYTAVSGTVLFPPGATVRTVLVPVSGDMIAEGDEAFVLTLSAPVNATLARGQATGIIENDDHPFRLAQGAVSNDSRPDLIIGSPGTPSDSGKAYVMFGGPLRTGAVSVATADTALQGAAAGDLFGFSIATGHILGASSTLPENLAVGAPGAIAGRGVVYVFTGGFTSASTVSASDAAFRIVGAPGDRLGTSLATADFNNDGHRDLVVGAAGTGRVYVINGAAGLSGTLDLSNPATPANVTIAGFRRGDVFAAADVTGDGIPDLLAGSADRNMALLYIGRPSGGLPATPDATFAGAHAGDLAGAGIRAGDVDGDGVLDMLIGAPGVDGPSNDRADAGATYVLWGGASLTSRTLSQADVTIYGAAAGDRSGAFVASGDINRDGTDDVVMPGGIAAAPLNVYYGRSRSTFGSLQPDGHRSVDLLASGVADRRIVTSGLDPLSAVQVFEEGGLGAHDLVSTVSTATSTDGLVYFFTSPRITPRSRTLNLAVNENGIVSTTDIVSNPSDVAISWSAVSNSPWLSVQSNVGAAVNSADGSLTLSAAVAALTPGSYVGTVTLTSTSHHLHMAVPVTVNLTVTSTRVFIDSPAASSTVSQPFNISGWALERTSTTNTGVDAIHVYAYPNPGSGRAAVFLGAATYGMPRGDVAAAYGAQFQNSGYSLPVRGLAPGPYRLVVYAHHAASGVFTHYNWVDVNVTNRPAMGIYTPAANSIVSSSIEVSGWAIDRAAAVGAGVDSVHVYVFPNVGSGQLPVFIGAASYGWSQADVGALFGSQFTNSGFHFTITGLQPGVHDLAVYARSTVSGTFDQVTVRRITVNANALMGLDLPSAESSVGTNFTVAGWAIDRAALAGTGVDAVHVYAYKNPGSGTAPVFLGVAAYGQSRPDVAAIYGTRFTNSAFALNVSTLTPGVYDIVIFAHSTATNTFNDWAVVRTTVR